MENAEGTEMRNCNCCRKNFPLPDFQNRYGKTFRWCINCREKRVQDHNERTRRKAATLAAIDAGHAPRRAPTDGTRQEKSLPPEPSALSELRHCARCHRHLLSNVVDSQPGPYFGWCTECRDASQPGGTAGGAGRQRPPLPNVRLPQMSPKPLPAAFNPWMYAPAASFPESEAEANRLRNPRINIPQRALAAAAVTPSDARSRFSRLHGPRHDNSHCMSSPNAQINTTGPVIDEGFDDQKGKPASKVKPGNRFVRSGDGDDEIGRAMVILLDVLDRVPENFDASLEQ